MDRRALLATLAAASTLTLTACGGGGEDAGGGGTGGGAAVEEYPVDEVRLIVPYPAGSGPDSSARVIATELERQLDVSMTVENIEGAQSQTGMYELSRERPDGSALAFVGASAVTLNPYLVPDSPFEGPEGITAVAQVKGVPAVLFASPDKGWDSVEDFVAEAEANPGALTVGLPNPGSSQAIQFNLLVEEAGIDVETINYGAGEMVLPAANGTVDASVAQPAPVVQYVEAGDLEFVGVFGGAVPEGLEEVPSVDDAGYDTASVQGWEGFVGPPGMEEELVARLSEEIETAVASDAFREHITTTFGITEFIGAEEFDQKVREEHEAAPEVIERFGLSG